MSINFKSKIFDFKLIRMYFVKSKNKTLIDAIFDKMYKNEKMT